MWLGFAIILTGTIIYLWLLSLKKDPVKNLSFSKLHYLWIVLWFIGIGIISTSFARPECPDLNKLKAQKVAKGEVIDISHKTSGDKLLVKVTSTYNSQGRKQTYNNFFLYISSDAVNCNVGNEIMFPLIGVERIENSPNSLKTGYAEAMNKRGIFYMINSEGKVIKDTYKRNLFSYNISKTHDNVVSFIEKQPLKTETKRFIIPLLTGDKAYLDESTRTIFSDAGMAHVLALSGFHIGIITALVLFLLFPLNFIGKYKLRLFLTAILLWIYTFISGMSPSTVRACIMATVFIIAIIFERKNTTLNSLALAGFIILLISPNSLFEIGFQLSFISVGSLIIFSNKIHPIDRRRHPKLYNIFGLILASLIVTFATWILTCYYFGSLPTMFLPANLLILPVLPFYVLIILVYFLLNSLHLRIPFLGQTIDTAYSWFRKILSLCGEDFLMKIHVSEVSVILWMVGLLCLAYLFHFKKTRLMVTSACLLFFLSIILIVVLPDENPNGIIIRGSSREFIIVAGNRLEEKEYHIPRHLTSLHRVYGKKILIIDTPIDTDNMEGSYDISLVIEKCKSKGDIDYVVLGSGYKDNIKRINETFNPEMIILHPSFRKKKEQILLFEADSLNISIHSIRNQKPFHIYN